MHVSQHTKGLRMSQLKYSPWIAQDAMQLHRLFSDNPQAAIAQLQQQPQLKEMLLDLLSQSNRYAQTIDKYVLATTMDTRGRLLSASQAYCDLTGYSADELLGNSYALIIHPDNNPMLLDDMWQMLNTHQSWHGELKGLSKTNQVFWVQVNIDAILNTHNELIGFIAIYHDITQRKQIELMSITDELTGCYNRRHFNTLFTMEIARNKRDQHWMVFMMIDADNFKKYNDTYGHQAGDQVLLTIGNTLKTVFKRATDYVFRLGGEEFGVLFTVQNPDDAALIANTVLQSMNDKAIEHSANPPWNIATLSLGLVVIDPNTDYIIEEIYKYADEALYRAKHKGRNRYELVNIDEGSDIELF